MIDSLAYLTSELLPQVSLKWKLELDSFIDIFRPDQVEPTDFFVCTLLINKNKHFKSFLDWPSNDSDKSHVCKWYNRITESKRNAT